MKTKILLLILLLIFVNQMFSQSCKVSIPNTQLNVDANNYNLLPGDTLCIETGNRDYLRIANLHGDSLNYIIVINKGGSVNIQNNYHFYGINFSNCSFFRFTGTGSDTINYGFKILGTKANMNGLSVDNKSTNYEIDHIEIANTGFAGIMAKSEPLCDLSTNYGYFTQYQTSIHDNYIHNTAGEGLYIGHSFFSGFPTTCNQQPDTLYPHEIKGLRIYNNLLENCKWDGIQVGCATEDCEIYSNTIKNYGTDLIEGQNSGIQISGGTTGKCYNNFIADGNGNGISVFGLGNNLIYNNLILNSGKYYFPLDQTKRACGIFCDDRTTLQGRFFNFINNTIIKPKTDGIRFYSTQSTNNKFYNNIIIKPGSLGSYSTPNQSYIYLLNGVNANFSNNFFDSTMVYIKFIDTLNNNYKLTQLSPAKDAGIDVSLFGINYDFNFYPRPYSNAYDIGAFEYYPGNSIIQNTVNTNEIIIFPNPNKGIFKIQCNLNSTKKDCNMHILNQLGQLIFRTNFKSDEIQNIDISKFTKSGIYFIILQSENYSLYKKLIIK